MSRITSLFLLTGIAVIYAALSLYQIDLPGLHYDEAFEAAPALQLLQGQPVTTFRGHGLNLGGHRLPLMTQDYIGAINTYLAIPFIAFFGPTPAALRIMSIVVGGLTLWLAYMLTSQLTCRRWAGLTAAALLAVDPTFIFWNRQGIFVTAVTATIGLAATLCWLRRLQGGSTRWAIAGAFLFGLGIYAKLLFVWLMAALVGAVILLNTPKIIPQARIAWRGRDAKKSPGFVATPLKLSTGDRRLSKIWLALVAFVWGCLPLLLYNAQTGGTFLSITQNAGQSYYGVNNLNFLSNLVERSGQLLVVINSGQLWYLGNVWSTPLPSLLLGIFLFLVVLLATRKVKKDSEQISNLTPLPLPGATAHQITLFPFLVLGLVVLFSSTGTVSALWPTHFALLMPWPAITLAVAAWFIVTARQLPWQKLVRFSVWTCLALLLGVNLMNTLRYHAALTVSGGLGGHSDAIYDLSDWLDRHRSTPVAAMDWGLSAPVTYLTAGRVAPVEVFGYEWESDAALTARLKGLIAQPATLYLWRAPDEIIFNRSNDFKALYRPLNLEENIEAAFYERSGRPLLGITRLVPQGTATNAPK